MKDKNEKIRAFRWIRIKDKDENKKEKAFLTGLTGLAG